MDIAQWQNLEKVRQFFPNSFKNTTKCWKIKMQWTGYLEKKSYGLLKKKNWISHVYHYKQMSHQFGNTIEDEQVRHEYSQNSEATGRAEGELSFPLNGQLYLPCLSRMIQNGAGDKRGDSHFTITIMEELLRSRGIFFSKCYKTAAVSFCDYPQIVSRVMTGSLTHHFPVNFYSCFLLWIVSVHLRCKWFQQGLLSMLELEIQLVLCFKDQIELIQDQLPSKLNLVAFTHLMFPKHDPS